MNLLIICPSQQIMKDKWINAGYDAEELKPHAEPVIDYSDASRIGECSHTIWTLP